MIFTLGHSTSTEAEFGSAARGMDAILDIRSHPGSRACPQFNREAMEDWLPERGLGYEWWPDLGGWAAQDLGRYREPMAAVGVDVAVYARSFFPKQRIAAKRTSEGAHPQWWNQGLYDHAWFMTTERFLHSVDLLLQSQDRYGRAALVCAEAQWWRCHRSMVADYLTWLGVPCAHLPAKLPRRETTPRFVAHADVIGNRLERYDPAILKKWEEWGSLRG